MGAGTLIINNGAGNTNTYSGGTIIENGTLQVNNTAGSATGTGAVTVKTGGTLSGLTAQGSSTGTTGSISGVVEIQDTGKLLTQSGGTLTLGGLTLDAGALSIFQLGALTATKLINITGSDLFHLAGASTIEIVNTGLMAAGTYSLFGYAGDALADISNITLTADHVGAFSIALVNNEAGNSIDLSVTSVTTGQWTGNAAPDTNWSNSGNWFTGVVPDGTGAGAQFVSGTSEANVDASKTVGSITFDNSTTAFTITSSGASTLTLDETGGNALIQVLSAPINANHVISAPLVLADNLTVNIAANAGGFGLDLSGAISESDGGTTLTKTGDGPLTLSGTAANTYTGLTTVSGGTLNLNKTAGVDAIGSGGLQIDYGATAALRASNQINDSAIVTVNGTFALGTSSETIAALAGGGEVTTGSGSVLTIGGAADSSFIGTISGAGGFTKSGVGVLTLSGVNTYTGGTAINAGMLKIDADNNLGDAGDITFGGGTLSFSDSFTSVRNVILSGNGTLDTDGKDVTLTGQISGGGGLTATGAGTLTLSAVNNYTGATTIDAGSTLALDATGALADSSGILNNGTLTIAASKTIDSMTGTGGTTLTSGTLILGDASATVATYGGVLSGAGNLATGAFAGSLTLSGVNTYMGSTTIGAGSTLALDSTGIIAASSGVMNNGTFTVAASKTIDSLAGTGGTTLTAGTLTIGDGSNTSSAYNGVFSGAGGIRTGGTGTLTLGGANTFSGATEIVSGSTLAIASGGDLGGGDVTHAGAFNIGLNTVNVAAYTMSGAATLNVSIFGATHGLIKGTGAATVNGTDTLVLSVSNYIENNSTYTIIDGVGGAGVAVPIIQVTGNTHATFAATTIGEDLILTASRSASGFASDAPSGNANAAAVGVVLDGIQNASGDMLTVLNTLDGESFGDVGNALETMTPDASSGQTEASRAITSQGFAMVSNRLGGARSGGFVGTGVSAGEMLNGFGVWMQGLGSYMKQGERKGIQGYKANIFGTTIGVDKLIESHFRAGFAGSYGWAGVNSKQPGSPSDNINSYQGTVYGSYDSLNLFEARKLGKNSREAVRNQGDDFWYLDGMAAFTQNNYDSRREIWLTPTAKRVAKADHYGQQYSTNFETGYTFTFEKTRELEVTPFLGLGYNYLYMNKYKETGASALNLNVNGEGYQQLEQSLGMKLAYPLLAKKMGTFIPSAKAAWLYDYIGDRFQTTASFAGGGSSFDTIGAKPAKSGMLFGVEVAFLNKGNMTVTGNWDLEIKDQFMSNTYYGTVRYDF
jgi:fibronectin-binding autotransporter adhesin